MFSLQPPKNDFSSIGILKGSAFELTLLFILFYRILIYCKMNSNMAFCRQGGWLIIHLIGSSHCQFTAYVEDEALCIEAGMNDFLAKPFSPAELFETLPSALNRLDV